MSNNTETAVTRRQRDGLNASKDMSSFNRAMTYRDTVKVVQETGVGSADLIAPIAGIPAFTLVALDLNELMQKADKDIEAKMPCFGITKEVTAPNSRGSVVSHGIIENSLWTFSPRAILFVGNDGAITENPTHTGFLQKIGYAISATKISINIEDFYIRRS